MLANIQPEGYYVLRNPSLPIEPFLQLVSEKDPKKFENKLRKLTQNPDINRALLVASVALHERIETWLNNGKISEIPQLIASIYKYLARMTTRCTPYGMFAGVSTGVIEAETAVVFDEENPHKYIARLDMNYVSELIQYILSVPTINQHLLFFPNTSIYSLPEQYRYIESSIVDKNKKYAICSVQANPALSQIFDFAKEGKFPNEIAQLLVDDETPLEEAEEFVQQLIEAQLLVAEVEPQSTNPFFFQFLIQKLSAIKTAKPLYETLIKIQEQLNKEIYSANSHQAILGELSKIIATNAQDLVQIDTFRRTSKNQLSKHAINKITEQIKELIPYLAKPTTSNNLENFRKAFYEKYQEQEIPLSIALDNEYGIGYGDATNTNIGNLPLIESLIFNETTAPKSYINNTLQAFLLEKYTESIKFQQKEINITPADLARLEKRTFSTFPSSLYLFGNLLASNRQSVDDKNFTFSLLALSGPSATNLISRFCYGDETLQAFVEKTHEKEKNVFGGAIVAEIVHIPEARIGNILIRPPARTYEIPYLGNSSVNPEFRINLDDIMVSVPNGQKVMLRSKKHNKVIVPRLTSAHNPQNSLPVYSFLYDFQNEFGSINMAFSWGILKSQKYLPAVRYKNILLQRATWNLNTQDLKFDCKALIKHYDITRYVVMIEKDNELFLDLRNPICQNILLESIQKKKEVKLCEFTQLPQNCFIKGNKGSYTNELIIPYFNAENKVFLQKNSQNNTQIQENFLLGSEWLYLKIYAGKGIIDKFLQDDLRIFIENLLSKKQIKQFFFIRYEDKEGFHLRIRLLLNIDNQALTSKQILEYFNLFVEEKRFDKILMDSYIRETERYGADTIELTESIFNDDSLLALNILGSVDSEYRWLLTLKMLDAQLNSFGLNLEDKKNLLSAISETFLIEFKAEIGLKKQLSQLFRERSQAIKAIMQPQTSDEGLQDIFNLISQYAENIQPLATKISQSYPKPKVYSIISSHLHMLTNRMFISEPRTHELVLYHHLFKYYEFLVATRR